MKDSSSDNLILIFLLIVYVYINLASNISIQSDSIQAILI